MRNASRFIVKADILNFYPSVYTHSIPWALHTKPVAKKQRKFHQNFGNKIDTAVRNGQEGQTKGIPIGPDTSFVVAEIIMTSIDESIISKLGTKYYRCVDDFEFGCSTAQEADNVLGYLQEVVADYELTLNPEKTNIIELPASIDPLWIHELGAFEFRDTVRGQQKDLLHYFDLSMDRFRSCGDDPVIKYAIKRTSSLNIKPANWSLYENLLLQWAIAEPGVLPITIDFIKYHMDNGAPIDIDRVKETLQYIIKVHAARGHTSELAWSVWGMVLFQVPFDKEVVDTIADVENPVIALLCLDAQNQGLISKSYVFKRWFALMAKEELKGANWLLAYEALMKGWLPSLDGTDYLTTAERQGKRCQEPFCSIYLARFGSSQNEMEDVEYSRVSRRHSAEVGEAMKETVTTTRGLKQVANKKHWTVEHILDPSTGKYRDRYFFKGEPAQRIPITSRLAQQLAGYALIERDLRMAQEWLERINLLSKDQIDQGKEGWALTEKSDPDHSLTLALFVAAVNFYGKCFSECEGRKVKLDRSFVATDLRNTHDLMIRFRNNFAAHSGAAKLEDVQVVLVLNPHEKHSDDNPMLVRELIQPEAYVSLDPSERGFLRLVESARLSVLKKLDDINNKIFADEIHPKGLDYWYSQEHY